MDHWQGKMERSMVDSLPHSQGNRSENWEKQQICMSCSVVNSTEVKLASKHTLGMKSPIHIVVREAYLGALQT